MLAVLGSGHAGEVQQGTRVLTVWLSWTGTGVHPGEPHNRTKQCILHFGSSFSHSRLLPSTQPCLIPALGSGLKAGHCSWLQRKMGALHREEEMIRGDGRWPEAWPTLPCACCQCRTGNHCHHSKPHLELPTLRRNGQPVLSCSWARWFLLNKQDTTWVTLLLAREQKKGEEIHKAIVHAWFSGRLHCSSLFGASLPSLIASVLLDSGFSPGVTVKSYYLVDVNAIVSGGTFPSHWLLFDSR